MGEIKTGRCYDLPTDLAATPYKLHAFASIKIGIPLVAIGLITNIICIMLWSRLMRRSRNRNISCGIYLITIAIVDIGTITSFFTCDVLFYLKPTLVHNDLYNVFYAYLGYPSYMFFSFLSFWLIAGVDTCRLTMVLFPVKLRQSATKITNTAIALIVLFVFGVNIPNFLAYKASHSVVDGKPCRWETALLLSASFKDYIYWFQCVFLTVFPWTIIIFVNLVMTIWNIMVPDYTPKSKKRAAEMGHLLFGVSSWFVIIIFFQCVAQCFFLRTPTVSNNWADVDSTFAFAKLGLVINSSTKLFLFLATSKTFCRAFMHLLTNPRLSYSYLPGKPTINLKNNTSLRKTILAQQKKKRSFFYGRSVNSVTSLPFNTATRFLATDLPTSVSTTESRCKLFTVVEDVANIQLELCDIDEKEINSI